MNISKVCVNLTGQDILSIINDFVNVNGLTLNEVTIDNGVEIKGSFKKGIKIDFKLLIDELNVVDGKVVGKLSKLKVYKLGIFRIFRSLALKTLIKVIGDIGIHTNKDVITVDINKILEKFPFIKINVKDVYIKENTVAAEVSNINLDLSKLNTEEKIEDVKECVEDTASVNNIEGKEENLVYESREDETLEENIEYEEILENAKKKEDYYTVGRDTTKEKIEEKLPDNAKVYSDYLFLIPDLVALIFRLLKDNRVPIKTKLAVSGSIAYIICPTDMIPNNIPFIGTIDDLAVIFFALNRIATDVPFNVLVENWSGKNELILVLKNGIEYVTNFTGARNIDKIYNIAQEVAAL
ncbi:YkvA family protein [Clostridium baratii]|uniref:YkvA family protein n=1 Tax=Clostridium baratii TaxID=1561 RepID=UPI0030CB8D75